MRENEKHLWDLIYNAILAYEKGLIKRKTLFYVVISAGKRIKVIHKLSTIPLDKKATI